MFVYCGGVIYFHRMLYVNVCGSICKLFKLLYGLCSFGWNFLQLYHAMEGYLDCTR